MQWQLHGEGAAFTLDAFHLQVAAHELAKALADGQPETGTTIDFTGAATFLLEGQEDVLDLFRRYADTVVDHLEGRCDLESAVRNTKTASRKFAKRQLTWLRGLTEGDLHWIPPVESGGAEAVVKLWSDELRGRRQT